MSRDVIISVSGLSKAYEIYQRPWHFLKEAVTGRKCHDLFWALRDVEFEVFKKERVGIIGANGSGKSTLLKIITGHLQPTAGNVQVNGSVSAMLSLNTMLNVEETGIQNIRFNLILNGCPQDKLEQRTEEIIEFTELGPFIYAPVKTYSTGMNAKLSFAITTAVEPDILVIDEVLSVGDAYFMGKATKRMVDLCERGNGLIFVSHATSAIQMLCDKVIWMESGSIRAMGPTEHILKLYEEDYRRQEDAAMRSGNAAKQTNQRNLVASAEMVSTESYRLRILADNAKGLMSDTHFVRSISVYDPPADEVLVNLNLPLTVHPEGHALDLLSSEWGRLYEHKQHECRLLTSRTGKYRGGHLLLKARDSIDGVWKFDFAFESSSYLGAESLCLEYLNYANGEWVRANLCDRIELRDGWVRYKYSVEIPIVNVNNVLLLRQRLEHLQKPTVEILETSLYSRGEKTFILKERQPFEVRVLVAIATVVEHADVGINIYRNDGVYVFWQSSGLNNMHIDNFSGTAELVFEFKENPFGSGDYSVGVYAGNGWDPENNFPHSEIFDFKVASAKFKIYPEYEAVSFGIVNTRADVRLSVL